VSEKIKICPMITASSFLTTEDFFIKILQLSKLFTEIAKWKGDNSFILI